MCPWAVFRIAFSKNIAIVDGRLFGLSFEGIYGIYQASVVLPLSLPSKALESMKAECND
jgi:hypothetical protein